jgi:hypothetical protein
VPQPVRMHALVDASLGGPALEHHRHLLAAAERLASVSSSWLDRLGQRSALLSTTQYRKPHVRLVPSIAISQVPQAGTNPNFLQNDGEDRRLFAPWHTYM